MKEYLSNILPEDFDRIVYPSIVAGTEIGIKDMFTDDMLITQNPEKYRPIVADEKPVEQLRRHPLQGEFLMPTVQPLKPLKLAGLSNKK